MTSCPSGAICLPYPRPGVNYSPRRSGAPQSQVLQTVLPNLRPWNGDVEVCNHTHSGWAEENWYYCVLGLSVPAPAAVSNIRQNIKFVTTGWIGRAWPNLEETNLYDNRIQQICSLSITWNRWNHRILLKALITKCWDLWQGMSERYFHNIYLLSQEMLRSS